MISQLATVRVAHALQDRSVVGIRLNGDDAPDLELLSRVNVEKADVGPQINHVDRAAQALQRGDDVARPVVKAVAVELVEDLNVSAAMAEHDPAVAATELVLGDSGAYQLTERVTKR